MQKHEIYISKTIRIDYDEKEHGVECCVCVWSAQLGLWKRESEQKLWEIYTSRSPIEYQEFIARETSDSSGESIAQSRLILASQIWIR